MSNPNFSLMPSQDDHYAQEARKHLEQSNPALLQPEVRNGILYKDGKPSITITQGRSTDQQRKMSPFSMTPPSFPDQKIGLNEALIRMGGKTYGGALQGNFITPMTDEYGVIQDYNRAAELAKYNAEADQYNKGLEAYNAAQKAKTNKAPQQSPYAAVTLNAIDTVFDQVTADNIPVWPFDNTTGLIGNLMSYVPGSAAHDVAANVETIVSSIGFDRLQKMRDDSPTGGALGQVSERELSQLNASLGNLRQSQSKEQFLRNLQIVKQHYISTVQAIYNQQVEYARTNGLPMPTPPDALQSSPAQGGVDPQTQSDIDKYANM